MTSRLIFASILLNCHIWAGFSQRKSENGATLPLGNNGAPAHIHCLIVFAEVVGEGVDPKESDLWKRGELPQDASLYIDKDFENPKSFLSTYFKDMSFGDFLITGDFPKHVISIGQEQVAGFRGRFGTNAVVDQLSRLIDSYSDSAQSPFYYGSTWQEFDQWSISDIKNGAYGQEKSNSPNGKIDALIIGWRNHPNFPGKQGEGLSMSLIHYPLGEDTLFSGFDNKAAFGFPGSGEGIRRFLLVEFFHALYGGNNWHTGAGASHHTFMMPTGSFGITAQPGGGVSNIANGFDHYHLGWEGLLSMNPRIRKRNLISAVNKSGHVEVNTDIDPTIKSDSLIVKLRDFVSTGDAIRIKLPHLQSVHAQTKNQYLWIENHQLIHPYDNSFFENDGCGKWSKGIYAYIQVGKDVKEGEIGDVFPGYSQSQWHKANSLASWLFPLSAEGNFDFNYKEDQKHQAPNVACAWKGKTIPYDKKSSRENPFTGYSDLYNCYNSDGDSLIFTKGGDEFQPGRSLIENGEVVYKLQEKGDEWDAFNSKGQLPKILFGISTNPAPVPVYTYTSGDRQRGSFANHNKFQTLKPYENRAIHLNGIQITLEDTVYNQELGGYDYVVKVKFDQYEISQPVRWCGRIFAYPGEKESSPFRLIVKKGGEVNLERGESPTQQTATGKINGIYSFTEPTELIITNGSNALIEKGGKLWVKDDSKLIVDGGKLIVKGRVYVKSQDQIVLKNGGRIETSGCGKVKVN